MTVRTSSVAAGTHQLREPAALPTVGQEFVLDPAFAHFDRLVFKQSGQILLNPLSDMSWQSLVHRLETTGALSGEKEPWHIGFSVNSTRTTAWLESSTRNPRTRWPFRAKVRLSHPTSADPHVVELSLEVQLNPTCLRAIAGKSDEAGELSVQHLLFQRFKGDGADDQDNVLPDCHLLHPVAEGCGLQDAEHSIDACSQLVMDSLVGRRVFGRPEPVVRCDPRSPVLSQVEIYWELDVPDRDATALINSRVAQWAGLAYETTARFWAKSLYGGNSVLSAQVMRDVSLATYAKTTDRIRIEVRYQRHLSTIIRGQQHSSLFDRLCRLAEHAADKATPATILFRSVEQPTTVRTAHLVAELAGKLSQVFCDEPPRFPPVLEQLLDRGYLEGGGSGIVTPNEARRLKRLDVVTTNRLRRRRRRGQPSIYPIHPRYLPLLSTDSTSTQP